MNRKGRGGLRAALMAAFVLLTVASPSAHSEDGKAHPKKHGFPREQRIDGLLGRVKTPRAVVVGFTDWFDGKPALVLGQERSLKPVGRDFKPRDSFPLALRPRWGRMLVKPGGARRLVVTARDTKSKRNAILGIDSKGTTRWTYRPAGKYVSNTALLYDAQGPYAVLVETSDHGMVALDPAGQVTWERKGRRHEDLATHDRLPGLLLAVTGDSVRLLEHDRTEIRQKPVLDFEPRMIPLKCLLFPDSKGQPSALMGGREHGRPVIGRVDAQGKALWHVLLPDNLEDLGMLEPAGRERVFVAVTEGFDMFLFDDEGTLLLRQKLHHGKQELAPLLRSIETGPFGADTWAIALVRIGARPWIYPVDVNRLPKAEKAAGKAEQAKKWAAADAEPCLSVLALRGPLLRHAVVRRAETRFSPCLQPRASGPVRRDPRCFEPALHRAR